MLVSTNFNYARDTMQLLKAATVGKPKNEINAKTISMTSNEAVVNGSKNSQVDHLEKQKENLLKQLEEVLRDNTKSEKHRDTQAGLIRGQLKELEAEIRRIQYEEVKKQFEQQHRELEKKPKEKGDKEKTPEQKFIEFASGISMDKIKELKVTKLKMEKSKLWENTAAANDEVLAAGIVRESFSDSAKVAKYKEHAMSLAKGKLAELSRSISEGKNVYTKNVLRNEEIAKLEVGVQGLESAINNKIKDIREKTEDYADSKRKEETTRELKVLGLCPNPRTF